MAEEVENPARRIPKAMILTILVGGVSALFSFGGYVLAAPDLQAIVSGEDADPIPAILESTLGPVGAKVFLVIAVTAFLSCVLSLQAAASRLLFSFARDGMIPGHRWLSKVTTGSKVPANALIVACTVPALIAVLVWLNADLLYPVTAFAVTGIYVAFQMVVLASLRQRLRGWKPAGPFSLGRWGIVVNIAALAYGIFALLLLRPRPAPRATSSPTGSCSSASGWCWRPASRTCSSRDPIASPTPPPATRSRSRSACGRTAVIARWRPPPCASRPRPRTGARDRPVPGRHTRALRYVRSAWRWTTATGRLRAGTPGSPEW